MQEDLIREYTINGGQPWSLVTIDTYRDGGTKVLQTSIPKNALKYYINNKTWTLHDAYPPDNSNIVTDKPTIAYIMFHRMNEVLLIQENLSVEGSRDRKINEILDK